MPALSDQRVLVLHNRYRTFGGEDRCVDCLIDIVPRFGGEVQAVQRSSAELSRAKAASGMLRGGLDPSEVGDAVREFGATVVHAHNIYPTFGHRALAAAREAGAAVVLHLHNYRLYCAIGTVYREDADCTLCAPNNPLPGVRHGCRESLPESLTYAWAVGRGQRSILDAVDRIIAPVPNLAENLQNELGRELPVDVVPYWLGDSEFAAASQAASGEYALLAGRVAKDKGVFTAISAAAESEVPLMIAGDGPDFEAARTHAKRTGAPVEFVGRLNGQALVAARMGAAFALLPSLWREVLPLTGLEALAAGLPLVTSDRGGLPDQTEPELVARAGDAADFAQKMSLLHGDAALRESFGERALARARSRFSEEAAAPALAGVYARARTARAAG